MAEDSDEACHCPEDFLSTFWRTYKSTVPHNILEFDYSFGYNCKKFFNLCLIDPDYLVFGSGNLIHFFCISKREMTFRRTAMGGGVGFITKNPNQEYNYLTVAENGTTPKIFLYKFPEMEAVATLEQGALKSFTYVTYNPEGELLASQAGDPDYMLTIWNWKTESIVLRTQAFQNDVLNVLFSPFNPTLLTSSGLGHVKFWKMCRTFTGLKLQGDLGRFGKTDMSDIFAIYMLPDEKVISGCDWGNMLLWDFGLIKLEVCRKNRKTCHGGPITQITMRNGEVTTVGMDGYVRIWFWETVEIADPPDDDRFVEIEPIYEFRIGDSEKVCELRHLIKIVPDDETHHKYYAQDGSGGIWKCDLDPEQKPEPPEKLFTCHGGKIVSMAASTISTNIATLGAGGKIHIYDYTQRKLLFIKQFIVPGCDLLWLPPSVAKSGCSIIIGFVDGLIRHVVIDLEESDAVKNHVHLIDITKPHTAPITKLAMNPKLTILVSASEDKTIFMHQLQPDSNYFKLIPIGYLTYPSIPRAINWHPSIDCTIIVGCSAGEVCESTLPEVPQPGTDASFLLDIPKKTFAFKSVKSAIRRELFIEERNRIKLAKRAKKMKELENLRKENPGIEINEETYLADSEEEEELEPLYIPKDPNPILWLRYTPENTIWISMAGYDAGYIYECVTSGRQTTVRNTIIADGDDIEIHSILEIDRFLIFGMEDGAIRVNAIKQNFRDLSDYWILTMHDNLNGIIPRIAQSFDGSYLFSVGFDGNIFSYKWNGPKIHHTPFQKIPLQLPEIVQDIDDPTYPSLEQQKKKSDYDRRMKIANERKQKVLDIVSVYKAQFTDILKLNKTMPASQQFGLRELELDSRITEDLATELDKEFALVRRKLEFEVEKSVLEQEKVVNYFIEPLQNFPFELSGVRTNTLVKSFRIQKLSDDFYFLKEEVQERLAREDLTGGSIVIKKKPRPKPPEPKQETEEYLMGMTEEELQKKLPSKMRRLLARHRSRKQYKQQRIIDWDTLKSLKPDRTKNHEDDDRAIEEAKRTIGDYKLRSDANFGTDQVQTTTRKYDELLKIREELHHLRNKFNEKLLKLRTEKKHLYAYVEEKKQALEFVHKQIPINERKFIPDLPPIDVSNEYPEENLKPKVEPNTGPDIEELVYRKSSVLHLPETQHAWRVKSKCIYEVQEYHALAFDVNKHLPPFDDVCEEIDRLPKVSEHSVKIFSRMIDNYPKTPWEIEISYKHTFDKIMEQDEMLLEIEEHIKIFDTHLDALSESRLEIEANAKFLENYMLTLNLELSILKDSQKIEGSLMSDVEKIAIERNDIIENIDDLRTNILDLKKNIEKMNDQVKGIQNAFLNQLKGNVFQDFLKRIFKKKYKPPKGSDDSESESESDEDDDDEEEEGDDESVDSENFSPMRMDESFCPPGCDRKIYDLTFVMRTERHLLEQNIITQNGIIDAKKHEVLTLENRLIKVQHTLADRKEKLIEFRRERQSVLNKVEALIVVRFDQMQYLRDGEDMNRTDNIILFNVDNVMKLYKRVGEIEQETLETKRRHKVNIVHLQRMNTDCKFMNKKRIELEEELRRAMLRRFGMVVDVDELEEAVLRKFIFQMKSNIEDERREYARMIAAKKDHLEKLEKELIAITQISTEKLNVLTVLQEEKNFLHDVLRYQQKIVEKSLKMKPFDLRPDICRLHQIHVHQEEQIEFLEKEIHTLRCRTKPLQAPAKIDDDAETIEILPPPGEKQYAESVYINLERSKKPPDNDGLTDPYLVDRITKCVEKFLCQTVGKEMNDATLRKYTEKISKYLVYIANNFELKHRDKVLAVLVENFQNMIPQKYLVYIKQKDIKSLLRNMIEAIDYERMEVSATEVLYGIVANSVEVLSSSPLTLNYTQDIMIEVFREVIEILSVEDLTDPMTAAHLCAALQKVPKFQPKCINTNILLDTAVEHVKKNSIDEMTVTILRMFMDRLVNCLLGKK